MSEITKKISVVLGSNFRAKRLSILIEMIRSVFEKKGSVKVLDVGGLRGYWQLLPENLIDKYKVEITVLRLPIEIKEADEGSFKFLYMDGCDLSAIQDDTYDIAHSNSVIEHVGDWDRMKSFASEITRVSAHHFVQAPNYWFPIEPHGMVLFFHWMPLPLRLMWVQHFKLGFWEKAKSVDEAMDIVESARLPNRKMFKALFPTSEIITERILGTPKSFIAHTRK